MFERLANSWRLTKASARVLSADKELVVFPLVSAATLLLVTGAWCISRTPLTVFSLKTKNLLRPSGSERGR